MSRAITSTSALLVSAPEENAVDLLFLRTALDLSAKSARRTLCARVDYAIKANAPMVVTRAR